MNQIHYLHMMRTLYLVLLLCNAQLLFSQSKRDHTWVLGYSTQIPDMPNTDLYGGFGGMRLNFADDPSRVKKFDIFSIGVSGAANDEEGNLQFYTSGCKIFNKNNEVMEGGDDITIGGSNAEWRCAELRGALLNLWSSTVILPMPESESKYLVFQLRLEEMLSGYVVYDHFFYSEVDMSANGGLGKVTKTGQIVLSDSLHDAVAAVRHGNGRDWWIIVPRGTEREFWEILLTSEGVQEPILRTLPKQAPFTLTWKEGDPPFTEHPIDEYMFESWSGQANFSPDGSKYCRIVPGNGVEIFDFDRCSGEMTFRRDISMPPDSNYIAAGLHVQGCGLAVSPNSRYLYFNNNLALFQFDMCEESLETGDYAFIEYFDYFFQDSLIPTDFFQIRNAPDGKIYMNSKGSVRSLHVIHEPNMPNKACRFEQRGLQLPRWNGSLFNYFPNFRLYDLADSPCDTLGIDDPNPPKPPYTFQEFRIFPNPASDEVLLYLPNCCDRANVLIWNIAGQLIEEIAVVPGNETWPVDVSGWAAGTYIVAAYMDAEMPVIRKLVVAHGN
jgi:hypothetical protein